MAYQYDEEKFNRRLGKRLQRLGLPPPEPQLEVQPKAKTTRAPRIARRDSAVEPASNPTNAPETRCTWRLGQLAELLAKQGPMAAAALQRATSAAFGWGKSRTIDFMAQAETARLIRYEVASELWTARRDDLIGTFKRSNSR